MTKVGRFFILIIIACILGSCSEMKWNNTELMEVRFPMFRYDDQYSEFWGQKDEKWFEVAAENFNAKQSQIKIVIDYIEPPGSADSYSFLNKEGIPLDIIRFDPSGRWNFEKVAHEMPEMLLDMTVYYTGSNASIPNNILLGGVRNGQLLMLPAKLQAVALEYNKELFDKLDVPYPPEDWTWKQLQDLSIQIQQIDGYLGSYFPDYPPIDLLSVVLRSSESDLLSSDEQTALGYMDSEEAIKAIRWIRSYYNEAGRIRRSEDNSLPVTIIDANVAIKTITIDNYKIGNRAQKEIIPYPRLEGKARSSFVNALGFGISSKSKNPQAAWEFINYLALEVNEDSLKYMERFVPASEVVAAEVRKFAEPEMLFFLDEIKYAVPNRGYIFWEVWNEELTLQLEEIIEAPDHEIPDLMYRLAQAFDVEMERHLAKEANEK